MGLVRLLAFVATRGLSRSRLTTALLIIAVAAGVGLQIPNTANLLGYSRAMFEEATTYGFGDVRVQDPREPIVDDGDALADDLRSVPGVRAAIPILTFPAGLRFGGQQIVCEVHGVDPRSSYKPYRVRDGKDLLSAAPQAKSGSGGSGATGTEDERVLVGGGLASKLGIKVGDRVEVRVLLPAPKVTRQPGESEDTPTSPIVAEYTLLVSGIADGAFGAYASLIVTRDVLARAIAKPHAASRVLLYADSNVASAGLSHARHDAPRATDALARDAVKRAPTMQAVTWMQEHPLAESALRANEVLGVVSHTMVVVAVTIPVGALLYVTVESRRREIAMLAALGFARTEIFVAFVLQTLAIGVTGSVIGCALGGGALRWFLAHPIFESAEFVVRPVVSAASFYEPALVIVIATVIAAMYPAWRATRVDPARVLRGAQ